MKQHGFTLLELLVTVMIIGSVFLVSSQTGMLGWKAKKGNQSVVAEIKKQLAEMKFMALSRNTTTRVTIVNTSGTYTLTTYVAPTPTTTCTAGGAAWTTVIAEVLDLSSAYEITGGGMANMCFYRDGTASGGAYSVAPVDDDSTDPVYNMEVYVATGYVDEE